MKLIKLTGVEAVDSKRPPSPPAQLISHLNLNLLPVTDSPNGSRIPPEPLSLVYL